MYVKKPIELSFFHHHGFSLVVIHIFEIYFVNLHVLKLLLCFSVRKQPTFRDATTGGKQISFVNTLIVQTSLAEKIKVEGSVTFQNIFSSMADFRGVVTMLPCSPTNKG